MYLLLVMIPSALGAGMIAASNGFTLADSCTCAVGGAAFGLALAVLRAGPRA